MQTNAEKLLAYRQELVEGGVNPTIADEMVRDAGSVLADSQGLIVRQAGAEDARTPAS